MLMMLAPVVRREASWRIEDSMCDISFSCVTYHFLQCLQVRLLSNGVLWCWRRWWPWWRRARRQRWWSMTTMMRMTIMIIMYVRWYPLAASCLSCKIFSLARSCKSIVECVGAKNHLRESIHFDNFFRSSWDDACPVMLQVLPHRTPSIKEMANFDDIDDLSRPQHGLAPWLSRSISNQFHIKFP